MHEYSHSRDAGKRRLRPPRPEASEVNGRYVYGDYCRNPLWSLRLQAPDAQDDRRLGLDVPGLTSFGEDSCGRVYAVSADGPVFRLEAEGATSSACPAARPCPVPGAARRRASPSHCTIEDPARASASGEYAGSARVARSAAWSPRACGPGLAGPEEPAST